MDKQLYALKGGCNLRFFFKSIRYSEDIDIDVQIIQKDTLRSKVNRILASQPFILMLRSRGIEIVNVSEPKQTETTQRWKIQLKVDAQEMPLNTKIEFSRRRFDEGALFESIDLDVLSKYKLPPILASHYSVNTAFKQKIEALISRTQTQARDVFDLYWLLHFGADNQLIISKFENDLSIAKDNALSILFQDFQSHVIAYLPEQYQVQYGDSTQWENILLRVIESLEK